MQRLVREHIAIKIADRIISDIEGRKGIGNEWEELDDEVKEQIRQQWITIGVMTIAETLE